MLLTILSITVNADEMSKNLLAGCDDFVNNGGHTYHSVFLVAYVNGVVTATKYNQSCFNVDIS